MAMGVGVLSVPTKSSPIGFIPMGFYIDFISIFIPYRKQRMPMASCFFCIYEETFNNEQGTRKTCALSSTENALHCSMHFSFIIFMPSTYSLTPCGLSIVSSQTNGTARKVQNTVE